MKVTLNHPESKHGFPVILDESGKVIHDVAAGITAVLKKVGVSPAEFSAFCNVLPTTLRTYGRSSATPANVLNMLGLLLENPQMARSQARGNIELTEEEKYALEMRKAGVSFAEIGRTLGLTRQRAYQIAETAVGKIDGCVQPKPEAKPKKPARSRKP